MQVVDTAGKALPPYHFAIARIDKFGGNAEARPGDLNRAGQAVAHVEQPADFPHVEVLATQAKRRGAGDNEQPAQARELGDELVRQALGDGGVGPRGGRRDDGGRPAHDMIASQAGIFFLQVEADMAAGVARRFDNFQRPARA